MKKTLKTGFLKTAKDVIINTQRENTKRAAIRAKDRANKRATKVALNPEVKMDANGKTVHSRGSQALKQTARTATYIAGQKYASETAANKYRSQVDIARANADADVKKAAIAKWNGLISQSPTNALTPGDEGTSDSGSTVGNFLEGSILGG